MGNIARQYLHAVIETWWNLAYLLLLAFYRGAPMLRRIGCAQWAARYAVFVRRPIVRLGLLLMALAIFVGVNFSAYYDAKIALGKAEEQLTERPILAGVRYIENRITSTDPELPYGLQLVVQTDKTIPSPKIIFEFSGNVGKGDLKIVGRVSNEGSIGPIVDHPNMFGADLSRPDFEPESPWVFRVYSESAVHVTGFLVQ